MNRELLYRYFSNAASAAEVSQVRAWAEASAANREELLRERAQYDSMLLLSDLAEELPTRHVRLSWLWKAAAVVAVAVLSSVATFMWMPAPEVQMLSLSVPQGQRLDLTLADGTHVTLNSGTTLRYPTVFGSRERRVEIDGEGYFEVARNEQAPFTVGTYRGEVTALGTTFDIDACEQECSFCAALIQGSVRVAVGDSEIVLAPGSKASLTAEGALAVSAITDYDEYRWREGIISFSNQSIKNIMHKFEKHFGVAIELSDDSKFDQAYSGKFYISDGVDYALRVLRQDIEFEADRDQDEHVITLR